MGLGSHMRAIPDRRCRSRSRQVSEQRRNESNSTAAAAHLCLWLRQLGATRNRRVGWGIEQGVGCGSRLDPAWQATLSAGCGSRHSVCGMRGSSRLDPAWQATPSAGSHSCRRGRQCCTLIAWPHSPLPPRPHRLPSVSTSVLALARDPQRDPRPAPQRDPRPNPQRDPWRR